ncbi:MAG: DUF501 domain-containing protein [Gaiellaceae bacterium]
MDDRAVVAQQIGRAPRSYLGVAARCPYGRPAVTEQAPYDAEGRPFPTTYWLTCPHLVAAVSRLEASGGVERWGERAAADPELRASLERATERQRALRRRLAGGKGVGADDGASLDAGIGGASRPERLKCLHAHVAWALVDPEYELGQAILRDIGHPWPAEGCCTADRSR